MSAFEFHWEWEDPLAAKGPELRATWARLEIRVDQTPVTRLIDLRTEASRDAIYAPLYPVCEWLVHVWWNLLNEPESGPSKHLEDSGFRSRHCLAAAGEGFSLPELFLIPTGDYCELRWFPAQPPFGSAQFIESGRTRVPVLALKRKLASLIDAVVARLQDQGIRNSSLEDEWNAIQALDGDETAFCEAAGALGCDPLSMSEEERERFIGLVGSWDPELLRDMLAVGDPGAFEGDVQRIDRATEAAKRHARALGPALVGAPRLSASNREMPWQLGYGYARQLRDHLGLDGNVFRDNASLAQAFEREDLPIVEGTAVFGRPSPFDSLAYIGEDRQEACVVNKSRDDSKRFTYCRSLWMQAVRHFQPGGSLVTHANTETQQANRAFAAEFLAPAKLLRERLDSASIDTDTLDDLAHEFGVSSAVIQHQIENHRLGRIETLSTNEPFSH